MTAIDRRSFIVTAMGSSMLAGCGALSTLTTPPKLYELSPKSTFEPALPRVRWQLLVEPTSAGTAVDTPRIAIRQAPLTIDYYAGVSWTDRAPEMVRRLIIESFENSGRIISVGPDLITLKADYTLTTDLREFQAERIAGTEPIVRVRLSARLIDASDRRIIGSTALERVEPIASPGFDAVIGAFDAALGHVLKRLVEWGLTTGEADRTS